MESRSSFITAVCNSWELGFADVEGAVWDHLLRATVEPGAVLGTGPRHWSRIVFGNEIRVCLRSPTTVKDPPRMLMMYNKAYQPYYTAKWSVYM
jgi:hypothetical protein